MGQGLKMTEDERARILAALDKWIRQRPGLEFGRSLASRWFS